MQGTISVVVPSEYDNQDLTVLESLRDVRYTKDRLEVILSTGNYPSIQRNKAAEEAKGDILYFFNGDSRIEPDIFNKVIGIFNKDEKIAGVGGPDLTPDDNNCLQQLFGYAMGSYFAHWKMRARYTQIGKERVSNEEELLLSNLAIRRDIYLKSNGFDKRLYPNEENELINRIVEMGYKFIYSPDIKIYRDRRKTILAFMRQFYRYGQGRMGQIFIEGWPRNVQFFIPPLFLFYLLMLPFAVKFWFAFIPLYIYSFLAILDAMYLSRKHKKNLILGLPATYLIMHAFYALGMCGGLLRNLTGAGYKQGRNYKPKVKIIKSLGR